MNASREDILSHDKEVLSKFSKQKGVSIMEDLKSDKEKLIAFSNKLGEISIPYSKINSDRSKQVLIKADNMISEVRKYIIDEVEKLP